MYVILCVEKRDIFVAHARTLVIPRFSIAGMVKPMSRSCSELVKEQDMPRTSDIELPLFYGVEVGRDGLDELGRELHGGTEDEQVVAWESESGGLAHV